MKSEIDKLIETPGIVAASKTEGGQAEVKASEGDVRRWEPLLAAGRHVLDVAEIDEVKITLERHTVVVVRSGEFSLGVVVVKSHEVIKSLKRMLRRAFKRMGTVAPEAPRRVPSIEVSTPEPTTPAPDPTTRAPLPPLKLL